MNREAFITAMRGVAHSVCVVTTNSDEGAFGATVSAFCSVSADPPTALVCLNSDARISEQVVKNGYFTINILPNEASHIANRFAGLHDDEVSDRFDGIELEQPNDALDSPELVGASVFRCRVKEVVTAGTHRVILGTVIESIAKTSRPLLYLEGQYHRAAPIHTEHE